MYATVKNGIVRVVGENEFEFASLMTIPPELVEAVPDELSGVYVLPDAVRMPLEHLVDTDMDAALKFVKANSLISVES